MELTAWQRVEAARLVSYIEDHGATHAQAMTLYRRIRRIAGANAMRAERDNDPSCWETPKAARVNERYAEQICERMGRLEMDLYRVGVGIDWPGIYPCVYELGNGCKRFDVV